MEQEVQKIRNSPTCVARKHLQRQMRLVTLVRSEETMALVLLVINRFQTAGPLLISFFYSRTCVA